MNENADERANDRVACHHNWQYIADEQGDAAEAHLYADCSVMECSLCGAARAVTDADIDAINADVAYNADAAYDLDY